MDPYERQSQQSYGLSELHRVHLRPQCESELQRLCEASLGPPVWRARKRSEARDLLALCEIAERVTLISLDLQTSLKAAIRMRAPVPYRRSPDEEVAIAEEADLVIRYPEEILRQPLPGYALVHILSPRRVHHPNVASHPTQPLCLGANVPRGFPVREAVLATYAALTLQAVTLDEMDPAGVMNGAAADFWRVRSERIPLSHEPFLTQRNHERVPA